MTIETVKEINYANFHYFFDPEVLEIFGTRIETGDYIMPNSCFITSENDVENKRKFTVRKFNETTGEIRIVGEFRQFDSLDAAKEFMYKIPC